MSLAKSLGLLFLLALTTATQMTLPRARRELHSSGRHLVHMHLGIAEVFGNSSSLMYYYTNLYVGDHENLSTQALILDTGSGIT